MTAERLRALNEEVVRLLGLSYAMCLHTVGERVEVSGEALLEALTANGLVVTERPKSVAFASTTKVDTSIVGQYHAEGREFRRVSGPGKQCGYSDVRAVPDQGGIFYQCMVCSNVMPPAWRDQVVAAGLPLPRTR